MGINLLKICDLLKILVIIILYKLLSQIFWTKLLAYRQDLNAFIRLDC